MKKNFVATSQPPFSVDPIYAGSEFDKLKTFALEATVIEPKLNEVLPCHPLLVLRQDFRSWTK